MSPARTRHNCTSQSAQQDRSGHQCDSWHLGCPQPGISWGCWDGEAVVQDFQGKLHSSQAYFHHRLVLFAVTSSFGTQFIHPRLGSRTSSKLPLRSCTFLFQLLERAVTESNLVVSVSTVAVASSQNLSMAPRTIVLLPQARKHHHRKSDTKDFSVSHGRTATVCASLC